MIVGWPSLAKISFSLADGTPDVCCAHVLHRRNQITAINLIAKWNQSACDKPKVRNTFITNCYRYSRDIQTTAL